MTSEKLSRSEWASYGLAFMALLLVLLKGLLAALFSGFLVYAVIHLLTPVLERQIRSGRARLVVVGGIGLVVMTGLGLAIWGAVAFFRSDAGSGPHLLAKLADIVEASRAQVPDSLQGSLPVDADALRTELTDWLRQHAAEAKNAGEQAGRTVAHIFIGMLIGMLASLHESVHPASAGPLVVALGRRLSRLSEAFRRVVFAQARISLINTGITAVFIFAVLPLGGVHLPLAKSLVAVTFVAGLLPVVGNLISNSMLVIVALSQSMQTAAAALLFMVCVHKLEYVLNAKIIGGHINAQVWELLVAMLAMESLFGLPGVIAAPVYYAYLKAELREAALI